MSLSTSTTAPTVDGLDFANLVAPTGGTLIWSDRNVQGQTFTTGNAWSTLSAVTVQLNVGEPSLLGWKDYLFRFGSVSSNTLDVQTSETVRQDNDVTPGSFFTFTLDSPVTLIPNTTYGFDVGVVASQDGWQAGIPSVQLSGGTFTEGTSYSAGRPSSPGTALNIESSDKIFHADIEAVAGSGFMTLQVDTGTGATTLIGGSVQDIEFNSYQVTSPGDSLSMSGWMSMADQDYEGNGPPNGSGNGWEEAGGSGAHSLGESYLLGNSTITTGGTISLGTAYDTSVDAQDLIFQYRDADGFIFDGNVEYVSSGPAADLSGDGDVDDEDLGLFFSAFTGPDNGPSLDPRADLSGDGDVDDEDLGIAFSEFTGPLGPVNVPEPGSLGLLAASGLLALRRRRHDRR